MPHRFEQISMPVSREPASLLSVDRAVSELRRGRIVTIYGGGGVATLTQAAEGVTNESLHELSKLSQSQPDLAITSMRASVLGLASSNNKVVLLKTPNMLTAEMIRDLADPLSELPSEQTGDLKDISIIEVLAHSCESAAVGLVKIARLLPSAVTAIIETQEAGDLPAWTTRHNLLLVDAGDIFQYEQTAARKLCAISEAKVPLQGAENTRIVAFRPSDGGLEHLAIIIGEPKSALTLKEKDRETVDPVLTRIHSECFTGDLLGSLRCDCGDQLRGAINEIDKAGGGILLYLAQEGRGIGLVNKLRAYKLQDQGYDTMEANEQLGFDADERVYLPAAQILQQLGFFRVRLMTNNPNKVEALSRCGVGVTERVPHTFPSNAHNEIYLRTKAERGGHLF